MRWKSSWERSARILDTDHDSDGVAEIARRSRGTPRVANRLLKRTRDYALVKADNRISGPVARAALEQLNVDPLGLDQSDNRLLSAIIDKFDGGPVGLGDSGGGPKRGLRYDYGRLGALSPAARFPGPHPARQSGHPGWPTSTWDVPSFHCRSAISPSWMDFRE